MEPEGHRGVGMAPGRLLTLADGIFAIAMTLLVLDLRLPDMTSTGAVDLLSRLATLTSRFGTFVITLVVGGLDPTLVRKVRQWIAVGPSIALVAIILAFVNPILSFLIYLALPVLFIAFNPVDSYFERLREGEI